MAFTQSLNVSQIPTNIDFTESNKALDELEKLDLNSQDAEKSIIELLRYKIITPYIHATVPKGLEIYRARINKDDEEFKNKLQISYNKKIRKIALGRANRKRQPIFYAAHKMETSIFETSSLTKLGNNSGKEIFTIGRWQVKEPFNVFALIPKLNILEFPDDFFKKYLAIIRESPFYNDTNVQRHLNFFSDQFIKLTKGDSNLYKISSEYFNHCLQRSEEKVYGILYPSVEYEYKDLNLALTPEAVDKYLVLDMVVKYETTLDGKTGSMIPLNTADIIKFKLK
jgi:hypothetical protein